MEVNVIFETNLHGIFSYRVPVPLEGRIILGAYVTVPLNRRLLTAVVVEISGDSALAGLHEVREIQNRPALLTSAIISLARWMADYYACPLSVALKSVLPGAVRKTAARHLERRFVSLPPSTPTDVRLGKIQQRVIALLEEEKEMAQADLLAATGTTGQTLQRMARQGLIQLFVRRVERNPHVDEQFLSSAPHSLTGEQKDALKAVEAALKRLQSASEDERNSSEQTKPSVLLLHGITGSGKTEIYLQAIAGVMSRGQGVIVLVPEISLTPQTIERFRARFITPEEPDLVAVLHSHLSEGERHDEWHKIREGRARIVIGARSAVFAPVHHLALLIVDEEHEHSYKQEEAPKYHARDLAVMRGKLEGAVVVLGSATPSLESYRNATTGKYSLLELHQRATEMRLPVVRVVDMRLEGRGQKRSGILSRELQEAISHRLERKEQTILFLNRRGYSTSLLCERCGYVANCPNCSVTLTYHLAQGRLLCHICGHEALAPSTCPNPQCANPAVRYAGIGTQKVEEVLTRVFPKAVVRRLDSDTLKRKHDLRDVLKDFRTGRIDILLGTQMIAKGLDFPNVTLVGIVNADLGLHLPDFRAGERVFQLLTQVSGRAGRGDVEGEVIVQSFTPFHPAIQFARRHDFLGFYEQEIEFRQQLSYPPFARVALLTVRGRNEDKVRFCTEHLARELNRRTQGWPGLVLSGPVAAPLARAESFYRYHVMLRTRQMTRLSVEIKQMDNDFNLPEGVKLSIDIDPVSLL